jgi:hypothetical protein
MGYTENGMDVPGAGRRLLRGRPRLRNLGESFRSPTGAARAVVRHYNPSVNDNRNGWGFWQIDSGGGPRAWLQSIRPTKTEWTERG